MNYCQSVPPILQILDYLVDERVGIVKFLREVPRESGAPDFFHYYAKSCNTLGFSSHQNFSYGGGASSSRELAAAKAIGEAVERYCSAVYELDACPLATFDSAPFPCVPPDQFALYSREQYASPGFPYVQFTRSTPVRWTPLMDLASNETWYVPACMVFMPYVFDEACCEQPIAQRISTGLACHSSFKEAAIAAICEVIERDAFTITWQGRLAPPRIRLRSLNDNNQDLIGRFQRAGYCVSVFHITLDVCVPSVLSVLQGTTSERPALVFAASTSLDPEQAVRKSLEELAHTARMCVQLKAERPTFDIGIWDEIRTQEDHVRLYCDRNKIQLAEFLFSSNKDVDLNEIECLATGDVEKDLGVLVQQVHALWNRVLVTDLTTSDMRDLGLRVVRAVIPGFHPLFVGHQNRALGGPRLWTVPQKVGHTGITRESGDNPAPHPYP